MTLSKLLRDSGCDNLRQLNDLGRSRRGTEVRMLLGEWRINARTTDAYESQVRATQIKEVTLMTTTLEK